MQVCSRYGKQTWQNNTRLIDIFLANICWNSCTYRRIARATGKATHIGGPQLLLLFWNMLLFFCECDRIRDTNCNYPIYLMLYHSSYPVWYLLCISCPLCWIFFSTSWTSLDKVILSNHFENDGVVLADEDHSYHKNVNSILHSPCQCLIFIL
jgi:hypothetical protein